MSKVEPPKDDNPKVSFSKVKGKPLFTVNGTDELVMHDGTKVRFDPALTPPKSDEVRDKIEEIFKKRVDEAVKFVNPKFSYHGSYDDDINEILALVKLQQEALLRDLSKSFIDDKAYKGYMVKQVIEARRYD